MASKCINTKYYSILDKHGRFWKRENFYSLALLFTTFSQNFSLQLVKFSKNRSQTVPPSLCMVYIWQINLRVRSFPIFATTTTHRVKCTTLLSLFCPCLQVDIWVVVLHSFISSKKRHHKFWQVLLKPASMLGMKATTSNTHVKKEIVRPRRAPVGSRLPLDSCLP